MNKKHTTHGFAIFEIILVLVVLCVIGAAGIFMVQRNKDNATTSNSSPTSEASPKSESVGKIKHLGVNLDYYDESTGMAGDFKFTKNELQFDRLFFEYGFTVPANSAGPEKKNPQPTFILPLGTSVHSMVDGEVVKVPKLYSNDFSIMVQAEGSDLIFETEHVINPKVKEGDKVKAGDVIAEVSDYDAKNYAGMGLVEIGVLKSGNPPSHVCLFDYLDDSIKDDTFKKITAFQKSWEEYRGDDTIHADNQVVPGCIDRTPIEG